jgi:ABC-2 type transport system ATP-binding protein
MGTETSQAIDVQHLTKRYRRAQSTAVDGISFSVGCGEFFGLLGPNGAGKTTTIGILTTRILPTSGNACIMGIDVIRDSIGVKQRISIVPQQSNLDQSLNAREILTFHARYHGVPRTEREKRADVLLRELDLSDRKKDMVRQYSGGMAQRLMLARALMHTPAVLFLDEPTHSLDPQSRLFLWDRLRTLNKQNITIVLTTHDMNEADSLCDRIAIMDHGKILALGTSQELKQLIPGGNCLELHIRVPERVTSGASDGLLASHIPWMEALCTLPGVIKVEEATSPEDTEQQPGMSVVRLYAEQVDSLIIPTTQVVAAASISLQNLRTVSASLEEVFIYLTGRKLRS